jgi:hypothetical protein
VTAALEGHHVAATTCPHHAVPKPDLCTTCQTARDINRRIDHEQRHCVPWCCPWHHSDEAFLDSCAVLGYSPLLAARLLAESKVKTGA